MYFSKSFGYALRSILYIASHSDKQQRIRADEIAQELDIPKYFLSKIMEKIARHGVLNSAKGMTGGFSLNPKTLETSLYNLLMLTDTDPGIENCVLGLKECNSKRPCALHEKMKEQKEQLRRLLKNTTVEMLLDPKAADLLTRMKTVTNQSL